VTRATRNGRPSRKSNSLNGRLPTPTGNIDTELAHVVVPKHADGPVILKNGRMILSTCDGPSPRDSRNLDGGLAIRGIPDPEFTIIIAAKRPHGPGLHDDGGVIHTTRDPSTVRGVRIDAADGKAGRDVRGTCKERTETREIPRDCHIRDEIRRHLLLGAAKFLLGNGLWRWNLWHGLWRWNLWHGLCHRWNLHRIFRKVL